jgi:hypothetical protein
MKPILDRYASTIEAKKDSEEKFVADLDGVLDTTVFSAGCSNWYINTEGRNAAAWPGLASSFWRATLFPKWNDFSMKGGSRFWVFKKLSRKLRMTSPAIWVAVLGFLGSIAWDRRDSLRSLHQRVKESSP